MKYYTLYLYFCINNVYLFTKSGGEKLTVNNVPYSMVFLSFFIFKHPLPPPYNE